MDMCDIADTSTSSFCRVVWKTIAAIMRAPELVIHFPTTRREIQQATQGFQSVSFGEAIRNCALVIDGHSLRMRTPVKVDVGNVRSYFSGWG